MVKKAKAPPRTRGEMRLDKRERIRIAATALFQSIGYEKTTTKAVAAKAGVASGTLFLYASNKEDLLFMVMQHQLAEAVEDGFATLPAKAPLVDQLMHIFRALFAMYGRQPKVGAAFVRALPGAKGANAREVDAITFAFLYRLANLIMAAQKRDEVGAHVVPGMAAESIFAVYFFCLLSWLSGYAALEAALEPGLRDLISLLIRGLRP